MVKSLSALAIFLFLAVAAIALPGFAPQVEAGQRPVSAKADRLELPVTNCSTQIWPNIAASCLRSANSGAQIMQARLITARR